MDIHNYFSIIQFWISVIELWIYMTELWISIITDLWIALIEEWVSITFRGLLPFHGRSTFLRFGCLPGAHSIRWFFFHSMMTSSNGNIFRVIGPLCGEIIGHRWIPPQRPVTRSFDVFFDLRLNKRLSKLSRHRWFDMPSRLLWHHCIRRIWPPEGPRQTIRMVLKMTTKIPPGKM